jgi:predicted acyl esterase
VPLDNPLVRDLSPSLFDQIFHANLRLLPSRWLAYPDYESALAAWQAEPPLHAIFENGGGADDPGAPQGTFAQDFASWPPPEVTPLRFYFQPDGSLAASPPTASGAASLFDLDPEAGERGILAPGGNVWDKLPHYDWRPPQPGYAVVFESAPLTENRVMLGTGSVDLWLRSPVDDADLQVNLSEIRPDGKEMYIQSGWLRASYRALAPSATELWPLPTYLQKDWALLTPGEWTQVRVALAGFGRILRAGSKIRVWVDTPGGSRAEWRFALKTFPGGEVTYTIGHDAAHPSSVALPLVTDLHVGSPLPPCPSLRGQPCRDHVPYANAPAP